jgi:RNA polymerase sigma-70 factor (ECF subfamily)
MSISGSLHIRTFVEKDHQRIRQRLLRIALTKLPTREDAEDLVQETFIRLLDSDQRFDSRENALHYIHRIFYNLRVDFYRRSRSLKRADEIRFVSIEDRLRTIALASSEDLFHRLASEQMIEIVSRTFKSLGEKCRRLYELLFEDEIERSEIPDILEISREAFENRLFYCRKRLKQKILQLL